MQSLLDVRHRILVGSGQNSGVSAKKRKGTKAVVIMATPCTKSLGGGNWGHKRQRGCQGRKACWTFATVSWSGAGGRAVVRIGINTKVSGYILVLAIRSRGQPIRYIVLGRCCMYWAMSIHWGRLGW